jgi:hypothetical protein
MAGGRTTSPVGVAGLGRSDPISERNRSITGLGTILARRGEQDELEAADSMVNSSRSFRHRK